MDDRCVLKYVLKAEDGMLELMRSRRLGAVLYCAVLCWAVGCCGVVVSYVLLRAVALCCVA